MKVHFWGTRGSLAASANTLDLRTKIVHALKRSLGHNFCNDSEIEAFVAGGPPFSRMGYYGSNTACVEIPDGEGRVICDAGTGIRDLSQHLRSIEDGIQDRTGLFHIFLSHLHWDHIQGFPFFEPAYKKGNKIFIYGCHPEMEKALRYQQAHVRAPAFCRRMKADITFVTLQPGSEYVIAGFNVSVIRQNHPGDSYGYRFELAGKSVVYSSDCEHFKDSANDNYSFLSFFNNADLLIFDAQYDFHDATDTKENWGHSNNIIAVELGVRAGVKHICLFHNEPTIDDEALDDFLTNTRRYLVRYDPDSPMKIDLAYDGLEIEI